MPHDIFSGGDKVTRRGVILPSGVHPCLLECPSLLTYHTLQCSAPHPPPLGCYPCVTPQRSTVTHQPDLAVKGNRSSFTNRLVVGLSPSFQGPMRASFVSRISGSFLWNPTPSPTEPRLGTFKPNACSWDENIMELWTCLGCWGVGVACCHQKQTPWFKQTHACCQYPPPPTTTTHTGQPMSGGGSRDGASYSQTSFIRTPRCHSEWVRIVKHMDYLIILNRKRLEELTRKFVRIVKHMNHMNNFK